MTKKEWNFLENKISEIVKRYCFKEDRIDVGTAFLLDCELGDLVRETYYAGKKKHVKETKNEQ